MSRRRARELLTDIEIPGTGVTLTGYDPPHAEAPKQQPYRFSKAHVEELKVGIELGLNIMLTGPQGCGKTSLPVQLAAYLGRPCIRFNMDGETRVMHIRGQQKPAAENGVLTLVFSLGLLATAMRKGYWVVLDEIDAALPSVLFVLQPVLEERHAVLHIPETGERIEAHPEFRVFATSNTVGYRSNMRGRHAGTNMMNTAFVDRFGMVIAADYPTKEEEIEILRLRVPALAAAENGEYMIEGIARTAEELRREERFRADFSTRRCIQWARLGERFRNSKWRAGEENGELPFDMLRAADLAVLRKLETPTDMKVARELINRIFAYEEEGKG